MANQSGGNRPFPAVVIVFLLLGACVYPGEEIIARLLPRIAGLASFKAGLVVLDVPVRSSLTIDLVIVPGLFILSYFVMILIGSAIRRVPAGRELAHRLGAVLSGWFILLVCLTAGGLASYGVEAYLPARVQKGLESLGIDAHLNTGFAPVQLHGNLISVVALAIGLAFFIARLKKSPKIQATVQLTREQRMTPYQRMLTERRGQGKPETCSNQPLYSLQPEAVNYRPM